MTKRRTQLMYFMLPCIAACLAVTLNGCGNAGIVKLSPDTYMLTRQDYGGIFGNAAKMKADVINEASEFAQKQGKIAIPLSVQETPLRSNVPGGFASIEYQFRVVDADDTEAKRTHLPKSPDVFIKRDDSIKIDIDAKIKNEDNNNSDLYTELTKLDDLLKRGILTQEEFDAQKKILLEKSM